MSLSTINTILNTAPVVIQGAARLIKLIRDRRPGDPPEAQMPHTIDGIKDEVDRLHSRLDINDESNVEQIKLIEQLAKQNETLAGQLKNTITRLNGITLLVVIALVISLAGLLLTFG